MFLKTFKGGIHLPDFKNLTNKAKIKSIATPKEVSMPLIQHTGAPCEPLIKAGDKVKIGTLIGKSEKFVSAPIHSSVSGIVKAIKKTPHPVIGRSDSVVIESDGKDAIETAEWAYKDDIESINAEAIIKIVQQAGIVGLGGAAFPTHVKLSPPKEKKIDVFILNGAECEPYLTCDERVMIERPEEIIKGSLLIMKALNIKQGYIAIEDNKPEAIDAMRAALNEIRNTRYEIRTVILPTKYPQGGEKQLIKAILNRVVPAGGLPLEVGCVVDNAQTALAVYEAVYKQKPLYERVITVTGDAIKEPSNLLVKIGTPISYIIDSCGGFREKPSKIIVGGPMMGIAQYDLSTPVIKGTSGILALSRKSSVDMDEGVCIRCGKCVEICPMGLVPTALMYRVKKELFEEAKEFGVINCFECGACAYECPAKIPLLDYMKFGKSKVL